MGRKGKSTDKQFVLRGQRKFKNEPHFIHTSTPNQPAPTQQVVLP
jgi:hypothetical protein